MLRSVRVAVALAAFGMASAVASQSMNQAILSYRAAEAECAEEFRRRVAGACGENCVAAAGARQTSCLATAERRYERVLRRELRLRR